MIDNNNNNNVVADFWIPFNTPSSKNSRIWTGEFFIPSKTTSRWLNRTKKSWKDGKNRFRKALEGLPKPYFIEFTFIRDSKRRFDYINIAQAPLDQMVKYGWLEDDDSKNVKPCFGNYGISREKPGLIIRILKQEPNHYGIQNLSTGSRGLLSED